MPGTSIDAPGGSAMGGLVHRAPWWAAAAVGSILTAIISLPRLLTVGASDIANYGWYRTAGDRLLGGLILDQTQYLQLTEYFAIAAPAPQAQPFTARALGPLLASYLGGDPVVSLWIVNLACLTAGTFAVARLAADLTGGRRGWTVAAVLLWSLSWPAFWYTGRIYVDPAAAGLAACALLAIYRRWLIPGVLLLAAAIWAKETALVLVPVAIARELLDHRTGHEDDPHEAAFDDPPTRWVRAVLWALAGLVAYLSLDVLVGSQPITFAPWVPPSPAAAFRMFSINVTSSSRLVHFVLAAWPAILGVVLWVRAERSHRRFMARRDALPLLVGVLTTSLVSAWSFFSAVWDGRTIWMSLPMGVLLVVTWGAHTDFRAWRELIRPVLIGGLASLVVMVGWVGVGRMVAGAVDADAAPAVTGIQPRFAAADLVAEPRGETEWRTSGGSTDTITVDAEGPVLLRYSSTSPVKVDRGDATLAEGSPKGTLLLDIAGPTELTVAADDSWTAWALPVDRALFWEALSPVSGTGPQVLLLPGGLVSSVELDLRGSDVTVELVGRCTLGECGSISGSGTLPAGTEAVVVDAAGEWTIIPESRSAGGEAVVLPGTVHD